MKVPENAREQLRATLKSMDMQPDKHWVDVPRWAVPLVLAYLDLQAAASEAVTTQVVDRAITGYDQRVATERCGSFAEAMEAAINAVAPALLLAGERRGIERATKVIQDLPTWDVWGSEQQVAAIRALGRPA